MTPDSSYCRNIESRCRVPSLWNDQQKGSAHDHTMPRKRSTPPSELGHRWFLADWAAHFFKRQADAQRELGWTKSQASRLWTGKQRYTQDLVDQAARWLGIAAWELLMPPNQALAIRRFRESAMAIAAEPDPPPFRSDGEPQKSRAA